MSDRQEPSAVAKLFGGLLMVAGALIAGLCGLCSAAMLVTSVASSGEFSGLAMIPLVGIVGGVPIAIGVGLFMLGRFLWRGPRKPEPKVETFE